jgi:hypothetical protein
LATATGSLGQPIYIYIYETLPLIRAAWGGIRATPAGYFILDLPLI